MLIGRFEAVFQDEILCVFFLNIGGMGIMGVMGRMGMMGAARRFCCEQQRLAEAKAA